MRNIILYIAAMLLQQIAVKAQPLQPSFAGFKSINGVNLYCEVIGKGQPLLIIHGGPGMSHDYFMPYLLPLAQKYKLIFYDQRASGRSDIPEDSLGVKYINMIADIEGIRTSLGLDKINLLAHSWGAILAVNYALEHGDRVRSLILSNSLSLSHEFDAMQQDNIKKRWQVDTSISTKSKLIKGEAGPVTSIRMKLAFLTAMYNINYVDSIQIKMPKRFADAQNAIYKGLTSDASKYDHDYYPLLKMIKAPVLVIHGDADNIPLAADEKLKASLTNAKLVQFNGSGHFPFIEEQNKYVETITDFLNGIK